MIKVVQVGRGDLLGGRFNGYSVADQLQERGIDSVHLVHDKRSDNPKVQTVFQSAASKRFIERMTALERKHGHHAIAQINSFGLAGYPNFQTAHVAHYHIIHDGFFSVAALPFLSRLKPSVWTWHDPWPMTGHCVYPMECERWRTGCGSCPDLERNFKTDFDNTKNAYALKRKLFQATKADIILASPWMMEMAKASPMAKGARLHLVPFGVDLNRFKPQDPTAARAALGVKPGYTVVAVRGMRSQFKGADLLSEALASIKTPICILSINDDRLYDCHIGHHQVIGLDWTDDEDRLIQAYTAADFFAMPSTAEAFGMMAIEAMACGKPVICFEGTSLPSVTFAPECGIAVPLRDVGALAAAVQHLVDDAQDLEARSRRARELAEEHYSIELYADRLAAIYRKVSKRNFKSNVGTERAA